jgi:Xaa-Pro dipeptidase
MTSTCKRLFEVISRSKEPVDSVVIINGLDKFTDHTFFYLTGYEHGTMEGSICVAHSDGKVEVITSPLEESSARRGHAKVHVCSDPKEREAIFSEMILSSPKVGYNGAELVLSSYRWLERAAEGRSLVDVAESIRQARVVKTNEEVEKIKGACDIASRAFEEVLSKIKVGMKEYEVAAELNYLMLRHGAQGPSFTTISAFGPNAAEPHYTSGSAVLSEGSLMVLDFGALYRRYCSDITRTIAIKKPKKELQRMYDLVREAQQLSMDSIKDGVDAKHPDAVAREFLDKSEFKGRFIHSLGHSLGLAVHDGYGMSTRAEFRLETGMVMTVEPGLYVPDLGGVRIEDDVVVTSSGIKILTTASRDLAVVG